MNSTFFKYTASAVSLTALLVVFSGLSVQAETAESSSRMEQIPSFSADQAHSLISIPPENENSELIAIPAEGNTEAELIADTTILTSASDLTAELSAEQNPETASAVADAVVAQAEVRPGRLTRSGPSYIGVAGNIGLAGRTAMSRGNAAVISKIGLTNNLSARPAAVIGNRTTFLIPVTADFSVWRTEPGGSLGVAPYIGGGVAVSTGNRSRVGPLLSGGVDVPVTTNFTATAGANVGFLRRTEVGVLLGVGYAF